MPTASVLLSSLPSARGVPDVDVTGLAWDSRRVEKGNLFFALPGTHNDGHRFISEAVARGAVAVVGEKPCSLSSAPYIPVPDARAALAYAAAAYYGHPTRDLRTIGVTGTNGKTTVVHLLGQILPACETVTTVRVEQEGLSCVTTPEAPDLQRLAATARAAGKNVLAFEASSIGLAQRRVVGVHLAAAVFTGLSRDHLDFHGTMAAYMGAKLRLFRMLTQDGVGIVNIEDRYAGQFLAACRGPRVRYGIDRGDVRARDLRLDATRAEFIVETPAGAEEVRLPFPGRHNVANALAAISVAWALREPLPDTVARLAEASLPQGRFVRVRLSTGAVVVVDYAHNPQALAEILTSLRPQARRLLVVFGASGEADAGKRPVMGGVVGRLADLAVITADNPKGEDPERIADALARGVRAMGGEYRVELDRAKAIRWAIANAAAGDVILLAGKGHERYQITSQGAIPHSDLDLALSEVSETSQLVQ